MAAAYANGQIPDSALVEISGRAGARLLSGPAASWERGCDGVEQRYGWRPAPTGPGDAYRWLALQVATFLDRYVPARTGGGYYGDVRWWNGVRYVRKKGVAAAAVPGTSNHGRGRAVDVTGLGGFTGTRYAQFAAVFLPLGWSNAEGRSVNEPWHWVDLLSPETVSSGHAVIPGVSVPIGSAALLAPPKPANPLKGKPMLIYAGGGIWLLDGGTMLPIGDGATANALAAAGVPTVTISKADADRWIAAGPPGLLMVRGPGTRGVALLGGAGGWSSMTSETDVTALQAKGVPIATVSDGQFVALMS